MFEACVSCGKRLRMACGTKKVSFTVLTAFVRFTILILQRQREHNLKYDTMVYGIRMWI